MSTEAEQSPNWQRYWILLGGIVIALGYLPMLSAPFDFTDDGNLVYGAAPGTSLSQHVCRWWDRVVANVEHLGPFRPVLWIHWEVAANTLQDSPLLWRLAKLVWCALAASCMLWLLDVLKQHPVAALLATAAAFWNPYRNEIWTSLTLAEGIAMPYAMLALIAARQATTSQRPWLWDLLAVGCFFATLGCKNTFVALLPAMVWLRGWTEAKSLREGLWSARWALAAYLLPLLMPLAHFIYFKLHWHAGQYETPGPSWAQTVRIFSWMKGAAGLDFLGVGLVLLLVGQFRTGVRELLQQHRAAIIPAAWLFLSGVAVYLPLDIMAARYTMPAVWGVDLLVAILLTQRLIRSPGWWERLTWLAVGLGILALMAANIGRQERLIARQNMIWDALRHIERTAPSNAIVDWISGDTSQTSFNVEEGIHFRWHLLHRGRGDVSLRLQNDKDQVISRVELPPVEGPALFKLTMNPVEPLLPWRLDLACSRSYRFGRQSYRCQIFKRVEGTAAVLDSWTLQLMKQGFEHPDESLFKLLGSSKSQDVDKSRAELKK